MPSAEKLQRSTDNKRAHALARIETRNGVDPADVDITERIFTSEEDENLPEFNVRRACGGAGAWCARNSPTACCCAPRTTVMAPTCLRSRHRHHAVDGVEQRQRVVISPTRPASIASAILFRVE